MPVVSIIVPVFNCAKTLEKAIQSACQQTLRDIEIVIVDDCSTDNSFELAQNLAASDPRIKVKRLSQNGGSSVARNEAIDMSTGEWIAVLDADDWIEPKRIEAMLAVVETYGADMICDELKIYDHVRNKVVDQTTHGVKGKISPLTAEMIFRNDSPMVRHAIGYLKPMVKKSFLTKHDIRNDPVHRSGQDFIFLAEIVLSGAKAILMPEAYYVYVHRISPTTRKISPHSRSDAGFKFIVQGSGELLEKYGSTMPADTRKALEHRCWIFESRILCDDMIAAVREKKFLKATGILIQRPFILILIVRTILKWVQANLIFYTRRLTLREQN